MEKVLDKAWMKKKKLLTWKRWNWGVKEKIASRHALEMSLRHRKLQTGALLLALFLVWRKGAREDEMYRFSEISPKINTVLKRMREREMSSALNEWREEASEIKRER